MKQRGGLHREGENQLWIIWQRAHLRAHDQETTDERNLRRGNDTADHYANEGRRLHTDVQNEVTRVAYLRDVMVARTS